jgi:hypothetical protein
MLRAAVFTGSGIDTEFIVGRDIFNGGEMLYIVGP